MLTRRAFLEHAAFFSALAKFQPSPPGRLVRIVPFLATGRRTPLETLLGSGLDARMFTDLSTLAPERLVTANDKFFVRTTSPRALPSAGDWKVTIGGLVQQPATLDLPSLERMSRPAGRILIECAGNTDPANYGLMSAADWDGAPLNEVLDRARPADRGTRVLVSGFDHDTSAAGTSVPGASWVFSRDDLRRALLAIRMNSERLQADHGAPVRLIVPGWYGCACIKWVNRIELVPDDALATSQMLEFARRTHNGPGVTLAKDYSPAVIDTAATPIRIEQWEVNGRTEYRIIGIIWGGSKPTNALAIRFRSADAWVPVENCPLPASTLTWSLWTHTWRPQPGRYEIVLKVTDPSVRTRRLDLFYYIREIAID